jgi:bifunctional DNase/RNase
MPPLAVHRILLPLLLIAMAACAGMRNGASSPAGAVGADEVEVEVASIGIDHDSGNHYVLLEDDDRDRGVPIVIGDSEAEAIGLEMNGLRPPRPLSEDLLRNVIEQTGNHVDRVVITDMRDEVYQAKIVLDGGRHNIDSRPSDAVALALGAHAPIYVNEKLFASSSQLSELGMNVALRRAPKSDRALGIAVQDLTPTLASYFQVAPHSAVLVNDVGSNASRAGVRRGDLITTIDGEPVAGVTDFDREVGSLKHGAPVVLEVRRGSLAQSITLQP